MTEYIIKERPAHGFSGNLHYYRKAKGLNETELADICKISNQMVSKYERGFRYPSLPILIALAQALEVSVDDLLRGENDYSIF
ncbi:MAG: helix-turn-helix domain-containing protein [Eubacterium sp.]|nr:helix-turn-helix domain-containing protein [Eubacterium sp.]